MAQASDRPDHESPSIEHETHEATQKTDPPDVAVSAVESSPSTADAFAEVTHVSRNETGNARPTSTTDDQPGRKGTPADEDKLLKSERTSGWLGIDLKLGFEAQVIAGAYHFVTEWLATKDKMDPARATTVRSDLFHHCVANCRAVSEGPGGALVAAQLSVAAEVLDFFGKQITMGKSAEVMLDDCLGDLAADLAGARAGISSPGRCYSECLSYSRKFK